MHPIMDALSQSMEGLECRVECHSAPVMERDFRRCSVYINIKKTVAHRNGQKVYVNNS